MGQTGKQLAHEDRPERQRRHHDRTRDRRPPPNHDEQEHRKEQRADQRAVQREEAGVGNACGRSACGRAARVRSLLGSRRPLHRTHARIEHGDECERREWRLQQEDAAPAEELRQETTKRGT